MLCAKAEGRSGIVNCKFEILQRIRKSDRCNLFLLFYYDKTSLLFLINLFCLQIILTAVTVLHIKLEDLSVHSIYLVSTELVMKGLTIIENRTQFTCCIIDYLEKSKSVKF